MESREQYQAAQVRSKRVSDGSETRQSNHGSLSRSNRQVPVPSLGLFQSRRKDNDRDTEILPCTSLPDFRSACRRTRHAVYTSLCTFYVFHENGTFYICNLFPLDESSYVHFSYVPRISVARRCYPFDRYAVRVHGCAHLERNLIPIQNDFSGARPSVITCVGTRCSACQS